MLRAYLADCLDKSTTNPTLSEWGCYADVVEINHRVRVAQQCLRPPDDLRIDVAGWLWAYSGEKQDVLGIGKQLTDPRRWKALSPGRLKQPRQRRGVQPLHLAIESRNGFSVRFGCPRDHNFHGRALARLPPHHSFATELSQTAQRVERLEATTLGRHREFVARSPPLFCAPLVLRPPFSAPACGWPLVGPTGRASRSSWRSLWQTANFLCVRRTHRRLAATHRKALPSVQISDCRARKLKLDREGAERAHRIGYSAGLRAPPRYIEISLPKDHVRTHHTKEQSEPLGVGARNRQPG